MTTPRLLGICTFLRSAVCSGRGTCRRRMFSATTSLCCRRCLTRRTACQYASSTLRDRRQSFRRRCLFDACVFGTLDPSLRFLDEKGWSVRLDWDLNSMPPPEFRDSRAAMAGLVVDLPWVESFSCRFRYSQHIHLLELEAPISLIRGFVDRGLGNRRVLCLVDSRVVLGSVCKGRSSRPTCELPSPSTGWSFVNKQIVARLVLGTLLGKNTATHHRVFYSVSKWRTALPLFSRCTSSFLT